MAEEKRKRAKRKTDTRQRRGSTQPQKEPMYLKKQLWGIGIMIGMAVACLGWFGFEMGGIGTFLSSLFAFLFGQPGILAIVAVAVGGFNLFYKDVFLSGNRAQAFASIFYLFLLPLFTLIGDVPSGREFDTAYLSGYGGFIGAILAWIFRAAFGVGAIVINIILVILIVIVWYRLSPRKGVEMVQRKTQPHLEAAREAVEEKVTETMAQARERYEEWQEERAARKVYDHEKDTRYEDRAREAVAVAMAAAKARDEARKLEAEGKKEDDFENPIDPQACSSQVMNVVDVDETDLPAANADSQAGFEGTDFTLSPQSLAPVRPSWMETQGREDSSAINRVTETTHDLEASLEDESSVDSADSREEAASLTALHTNPLDAPAVPTIDGEDLKAETSAVQVSRGDDGHTVYRVERPYRFPSFDILSKGPALSSAITEEVAHNAQLLEETLKNFGITAKVVNATQGPAVTRYEVQPAPGTKVSRIVNLTDDLKMSLAAADIRMEAPIPGKSAIGIEVPNKSVSPVHLRDVLDCDDFKQAKGGIPVGLGKDIAGQPIITDLAKMPHLLVAGSTGSGKSVCINTIIASILFSRKPEDVKLILIDPKMVELSVYNNIPHLMAPVVTDMKKASAVLRWAVREMEARYRTFADTGVRNLEGYNASHPDTAMPLILLIIDEMADLMMTAPADIEDSICRLAQMARAAGIHMILATQRPSVNVITGTIKANVPSRISFAVATQIDSRTILDMAGAEKLLGKGDMLFNPIGANKPVRIQGAFISDEEVEELVAFVKQQGQPEYNDLVTKVEEAEGKSEDTSRDEVRDELLERAVDLVMESGQASVSMLQRRFRIGYSRAARLVDTMEEMKIVGPSQGSKAREILMSPAQAKDLYFADPADTSGNS